MALAVMVWGVQLGGPMHAEMLLLNVLLLLLEVAMAGLQVRLVMQVEGIGRWQLLLDGGQQVVMHEQGGGGRIAVLMIVVINHPSGEEGGMRMVQGGQGMADGRQQVCQLVQMRLHGRCTLYMITPDFWIDLSITSAICSCQRCTTKDSPHYGT